MSFYLDSSVLVKRYIAEAGSLRVHEIIDSQTEIYISDITQVEVIAALTRRGKLSREATEVMHQARGDFRKDYASGTFRSVILTRQLLSEAAKLAERRALRGYNAVQLATALKVQQTQPDIPLVLVCADEELIKAATLEGLTVESVSI